MGSGTSVFRALSTTIAVASLLASVTGCSSESSNLSAGEARRAAASVVLSANDLGSSWAAGQATDDIASTCAPTFAASHLLARGAAYAFVSGETVRFGAVSGVTVAFSDNATAASAVATIAQARFSRCVVSHGSPQTGHPITFGIPVRSTSAGRPTDRRVNVVIPFTTTLSSTSLVNGRTTVVASPVHGQLAVSVLQEKQLVAVVLTLDVGDAIGPSGRDRITRLVAQRLTRAIG